MGKDDLRLFVMPACNDSMGSQCWGTEVRTDREDGQAKDPERRAEPRHRGQAPAIEPIIIEVFSQWVTHFLP